MDDFRITIRTSGHDVGRWEVMNEKGDKEQFGLSVTLRNFILTLMMGETSAILKFPVV